MTDATPKPILNVEDFFVPPTDPKFKTFTPEIFYGLSSGELQAQSVGENVSMRYVVKKCLDAGLTLHFQTYQVVMAETAKDLERATPHISMGTLSSHDITLLSNIFSLNGTTPFKGRSGLGEMTAKAAHNVIHTSGSRRHKDLHAAAFLALSEWDANSRFDADDWRRMAKGVEDKIAPALLARLLQTDPTEFARAAIQMTRAESSGSFPEGTRAKVFQGLGMLSLKIPAHLGQDKFETVCDRLSRNSTEEERGVLKVIGDAYKKLPVQSLDA